ncbi:MAG: flagellar hook-length control protein FliK [Oligoflexia bacterium]|nr:flagellar hook-length control protein FliK [Oligoflexia bacterium]
MKSAFQDPVAEPAQKKAGSNGADEAAFASELSLLAAAGQPQVKPVAVPAAGAAQGQPKPALDSDAPAVATTVSGAPAGKDAPMAGPMAGMMLGTSAILARDAQSLFQGESQAGLPIQNTKQAPNANLSSSSIQSGATNNERIANSTNTATAMAGLTPWSGGEAVPAGQPKHASMQASSAAKPETVTDRSMSTALPNELSAASMPGHPAMLQRGEVEAGADSRIPVADSRSAVANTVLNSQVPLQGQTFLASGVSVQQKSMGKTALSGSDFLSMRDMVQASGAGAGMGVAGNKVSGKADADAGLGSESGAGKGGFSGSGEQAFGLKLAGARSERAHADGRSAGQAAESAMSSLAGAGAGAKSSFALPAAATANPGISNLTGHVTQGSMAKDRLNSESLVTLGMGIRNIAPQGGGEIHLRLHPENLGELHLKVLADGNQVGLQIQASDDRARKILEESLGSLQESLASHQLSLKSVEFTVAQAGAAQGEFRDMGGQGQQSQTQHQSQQQSVGGQWSPSQQGFRDPQGRDGWGERSGSGSVAGAGGGFSSGLAAGNAFSARSRVAASNGRLDVMA